MNFNCYISILQIFYGGSVYILIDLLIVNRLVVFCFVLFCFCLFHAFITNFCNAHLIIFMNTCEIYVIKLLLLLLLLLKQLWLLCLYMYNCYSSRFVFIGIYGTIADDSNPFTKSFLNVRKLLAKQQ